MFRLTRRCRTRPLGAAPTIALPLTDVGAAPSMVAPTGEVQRIALPPQYANQKAVYDMALEAGSLVVRIRSVAATLEVVDIVEGISVRVISELDSPKRYLYVRMAMKGIVQYEVEGLTYTPIELFLNAFPGDFAFVDMNEPDSGELRRLLPHVAPNQAPGLRWPMRGR